ncbi:MAG: hypothetical protein M1317_01775 [Candidatus Thermoplasmatota archaeon]|nr:hypothetical protein [Candidatus Thermoplasmatota archaeon]
MASHIEKDIIKISISNAESLIALISDVVHISVWSAENYLYNRMNDLNPEEVNKAKKTTDELEQLLKKASTKYENAKEGWERCDKILSEGTLSKTIFEEASNKTDEFSNFSNKVMEKCESIRQEMLQNIKNSGVKP